MTSGSFLDEMYENDLGLESHQDTTASRTKMDDYVLTSSCKSSNKDNPQHFSFLSKEAFNNFSLTRRNKTSGLPATRQHNSHHPRQLSLSLFYPSIFSLLSSSSTSTKSFTLSKSPSSLSTLLWIILVLLFTFCCGCTGSVTAAASSSSSLSSSVDKAFFNTTSVITIPNSVWDLQETKQFSFKTCIDDGILLSMRGSLADSGSSSGTQELTLSLYNRSVMFVWSINGISGTVSVGDEVNNNKWYTLMLRQTLGALRLSIQADKNSPVMEVVVANSTINTFLLTVRLLGSLQIGLGFQGCVYNGPGVNLASPQATSTNIKWNSCPLDNQTTGCGERDDCWDSPCVRGQCRDVGDDFRCDCPRNYEGKRCEVDLARQYGCAVEPCLNGGTCYNLTTPNSNGRIYTCTCAEGYTGVDCETRLDYCRTNPCQNGQCVSGVNGYTCNCTGSGYTGDVCGADINECTSQQGVCGSYRCSNHPGGFSCNCPAGYEGAPCQDIDECASGPCLNGATCLDEINGYTCTCAPGYTGQTCDVNVNDCTDTSCTEPNTRCVDGVNSFRCVCLDGFSGGESGSCQNINECSQGVCKNNATCLDTQGSYTCDCVPGFDGQNCEVNIDECADQPCRNNASCTDLINDYSCACLPGFEGKDCQIDIDDCQGVDCLNGARCVDKVNEFECDCPSGWEGRYCATNIDDCSPNPCKNGAQCVDQLGGFLCQCKTGFNGTTCNTNINDCLPDPCYNNGVCFDGINDYNCNCTLQWMGKNCTEPYDACAFQPCKNNANCTTLPGREHSCNCVVGFSGKNCQENIDDCVGHDCPAHQVCYDGINEYTCGCPIGYSGDLCEIEINECDASPCLNDGVCNDMTGGYNCTCQQEIIDITKEIGPKGIFLTGYNGTNCEVDIDECAYRNPPICQNGALCKNKPGSFSCYCLAVADDGSLNVGKLCESQKTYCDLAPRECANGGTCVELAQSYRCQCAPGFSGEFCETDIDECESDPCQNGGTCSDRVNGYECACIEGITGHDCDVNINDCLPDPCNNGGICQDFINAFTCNCSDTGFDGNECENNIDDCVDNPCQHGGTCRDGIKEYTCECLPGYTGLDCEIDVAECASVPCFMGSLCLERSNESLYDKGDSRFENFSYETAAGYVCECIAGLKGVNCTEDVDECESRPCQNGAQCKNLFNDFSCQCAEGYEGRTCQNEIDECQVLQPCKNGGQCTDLVADYSCSCPEPVVVSQRRNYGGKNCTTYLKACDGNSRCGRNGDCLPKLENEERDLHSFTCVCQVGYTGQYCDQSTVFSFPSESYIRQRMDEFKFDLSLRFRTTLPDALLAVCKLGFDHWVAVRIHHGMVEFRYRYPGATNGWTTITTTSPVNDAQFHDLRVMLTHNITVILPHRSCSSSSNNNNNNNDDHHPPPCRVEQSYVATPNPPEPYLYIGSAIESGLNSDSDLMDHYVGCMEDVVFNGDLYYPGLRIGDYYQLQLGCPRQPQCQEDTCNGRGDCQDRWDSFQCDCHRPYHGNVCDKDYTPATFGGNPDQFASFSVVGSGQFRLSFIVTTRQTDGFIIYAGNNKINSHTFITLYIQNGLLMGNLALCQFVDPFETSVEINDGQAHLVEIVINSSPTLSLALSVDSVSAYQSGVIQLADNNNCRTLGFYATDVFIGKLDKLSTSSRRRRRRSITFMEEHGGADEMDDRSESERSGGISRMRRRRRRQAITGNEVIEENEQLAAFEGVMQDLRAYDFKLKFSQNSSGDIAPSRFQAELGALSTVDVCKEDLPCLNGGNCSNVYFNDFSCDCKRGYRGKNCSELDFCSYGTCPDLSTCVNIQDGYECVSTAQFSGSSWLTFDLSTEDFNPNPDPKVTIKFRTRALFGVLFYAGRAADDYFIKLRIARGRLQINYKLAKDEFSKSVTVQTPEVINDGQWYTAVLELASSSAANNGSSSTTPEMLHLDVMHKGVSLFAGAAGGGGSGSRAATKVPLDSGVDGGLDVASMLVAGPLLTLGGVTNQMMSSSVNRESRFVGCMEQARIGGVLLPFFSDDLFQNNSVPVRYLMQDKILIQPGCVSPDMCQNHKCANGGVCVDQWYDSTCQCQAGYQGVHCEDNPNNCLGSPCDNQGRCVDGLNGYTCQCATGFHGDRCQTDIDFCTSNSSNGGAGKCLNGGLCKEETNGFSCECTDEYTGQYCAVMKNQTCAQDLCQNGGACQPINTTIGGKQEASFECQCASGFEGPLCEEPINGCHMQPHPCHHAGTCSISSEAPYYTCDCSQIDYDGQNCTDKVDDCIGVSCGNGTCSDGDRSYVCTCDSGYTGQHCETRVDDCTMQPCQHGRCENNVCLCDGSGYEGTFCDQEIDECNRSVCVNADACQNLEGDFNCSCSLGYTGKTCAQPLCTPDLCLNGATCRTNDTHWWCECQEFYEGRQCEVKGPCADEPCKEMTTLFCSQNISVNEYTCHCRVGWEGKNCSEDINECTDSNPLPDCGQGTCDNTPGNFRCNCDLGYSGRYCNVDINWCDSSPCQNGGRCTEQVTNYECNCTGTGFRGTDCDQNINECLENVAICNKGKCNDNEGGFDCDCGQEYLGTFCQYPDPCVNSTCSNNGVCIKNQTDSGAYSASCQCDDGYQGFSCEKSPSRSSDDDDPNMALIIGPIVGGVLFIIIIIILIAFVMTARSKRATRGAYSPSQQETSGSRVELGNVLKKPPEERLI